uniref:Uncharacterized protein n=1 Tax=viral metagenome TaxID=1070528 RepID=A0A6M3M3Z2_9ZZZZ
MTKAPSKLTEAKAPSIKLSEALKCPLSCAKLVDKYRRPLTSENFEAQYVVLSDMAIKAKEKGDFNEYTKARSEQDCLRKWQLECVPQIKGEEREVARTRARLEKEAKELGIKPRKEKM